jgi:hypothetical protein
MLGFGLAIVRCSAKTERMISPRFQRLFKLAVWAGMALFLQQMSSAGEKLNRPFATHRLVVEKKPLPLAALSPLIVADDRLTLTGAWELISQDGKFGGLSAMMLAQGEMLFVSDAGAFVRMHGRPDAATSPTILTPLPGSCGDSWQAYHRDSESLALTPNGRGLRIGLETINALCMIDPARTAQASARPIAAMWGWRANYGAEAIATLPGKGMAIFGEGSVDGKGASPMLWYKGDAADPKTAMVRMKYLPPAGHRPTDAVFLPDGRMLVINRDFSLPFTFSAMLTLVPTFEPATDATVTGKVVARLTDPVIADNFEGIAIENHSGGTTIWIVSDDNFFPLQRSLLVRFELSGETPPAAKP